MAFEDPEEAEKAVTELHGKESPEGKVSILFQKYKNRKITNLFVYEDIRCL